MRLRQLLIAVGTSVAAMLVYDWLKSRGVLAGVTGPAITAPPLIRKVN